MGDDPARSSCQAEPIAIDWAQVLKSVSAKVAGKLLPLGISKEDVEDLVQDICLKASQKIEPSKMQHPNGVYAFVQLIAGNTINDYFEKRGRENQRRLPLNETVEDNQHRPAVICERISAGEAVKKIFEGQNGGKPLTKEERELLLKVLGEGIPYAEIQEDMRDRGLSTTTNALRQKVYRLVSMIRESWRNTK